MAQVKLLKIGSLGIPTEFSDTADDITLNSYTVQGGGPVLSGTGLDLNDQDVVDVSDLAFTDPSVGTINQTAGALIVDDIMAKERDNVMTTAGAVLFPTVSDTAGEVDAFRLPTLAGAPTATPTVSGSGYLIYDSTNKDVYIWDAGNASWDNLNTVKSVETSYTAGATIAARDAVYISAANTVSPADADADATSQAIGFAIAGAAAAASVAVRSIGALAGFTGLTAGARYFLSAGTAGTITATAPSGSGNTVLQVGYAKSTTELQILFGQAAKRA